MEDYGRGPDPNCVEEGVWWVGGRGEEGFADDKDGGVCYADVFLGAALDIGGG